MYAVVVAVDPPPLLAGLKEAEDEKSAEESANMESGVIRNVAVRNMARKRIM